jgi:maltooligosyltrehalose trehalohydrolase
MVRSHSMPFGAQICEDGAVRFRLWAPAAKTVDVCFEDNSRTSPISTPPISTSPLAKLENGWFELITREAKAGARYQFQINGGLKVPDPASRFQPSDVHGASQIVSPAAFDWTDEDWRGRPWEEAVIYELHVGMFTREGTFKAVEGKLDYLSELGVTAIELMPVADFPGRRNWGYDGVLLYAPDSSYGSPEELKSLVQAAHRKNLMVFLDVVYNHFGPEGNYLHAYSPQFFTKRHHTPWGDGINFDGPENRAVRDFFIHNALYWLEEYHFDGLRLDAVHAIVDESNPDIITELGEKVREKCSANRHVHLVLEDADNASHYLRRARVDGAKRGVRLYDAQWNDDIHHAMHVLITGESGGYYSDYAVEPIKQLRRCLTEGFAYQGQYSPFHHADRGEPTSGLPLSAFVSFLQNHDQVGNRAFGERIAQLTSPEALKAAMEVLLLAPSPPLLFMGEEFRADSPFLFFCDFKGDLAAAVTNGRRAEFAHFSDFSSQEKREQIPDPNHEATFLRSKLNWHSLTREFHAKWLDFYRELLTIRQQMIVPLVTKIREGSVTSDFDAGQRGVSIEWNLADGSRLSLFANLSNEELMLQSRNEALPVPIYASHAEVVKELENGRLSAWSVGWFLRSGR